MASALICQRALLAVVIAVYLASPTSPVSAAPADRDWADCTSGESTRVVRGCTAFLKNAKTPAERANANIYLGIAHSDRGNLTEARAAYKRAISLAPKNKIAYLNLADLELRAGDLKAAILNYGEVIKIDPKNASAYNGRANAYRESGQIPLAIADYGRAIQFDSQSPLAYNGRGNAFRDEGNLDRAIKDFDQALDLNPKYTTALISRANAYADKQDWQSAFRDYDAAIALDPNEAMAYNNRGTAYLESDLDRAVADYDKAIAVDGSRAAFYFNRALAHHLKGDLVRAVADYSETIKRDKDYAFAYRNRGLISQSKGDLDGAIADYTQAIRINDKDGQVRVSRGIAYLRKGEASKAADDLDQGLRLDDQQSAAYTALGEARTNLGRYNDALKALERAISLDPSSSEAYYQRGRVFHTQGDKVKSLKDYNEALALDPQHKPALEGKLALTDDSPPPPPVPPVALNRVALVIGNSDYQRVPRLVNPKRDATAVANTLLQIGFKHVTLVENQTRSEMIDALRKFRDQADNADWATVYYAGHGIEIDGKNYIIPVDAKLLSDRDVKDESIELSRLLESIGLARELKVVILDACRDNPFLAKMALSNQTRAITRGLGRIDEPGASTLIAFAASSGNVAQDGSGEGNSPYVKSMLERFRTPGLEINKVFRLIREDVRTETKGQQDPITSEQLGSNDYILYPALKP